MIHASGCWLQQSGDLIRFSAFFNQSDLSETGPHIMDRTACKYTLQSRSCDGLDAARKHDLAVQQCAWVPEVFLGGRDRA